MLLNFIYANEAHAAANANPSPVLGAAVAMATPPLSGAGALGANTPPTITVLRELSPNAKKIKDAQFYAG